MDGLGCLRILVRCGVELVGREEYLGVGDDGVTREPPLTGVYF
jgi:hypothetical protein